jgi:hypothetical protein
MVNARLPKRNLAAGNRGNPASYGNRTRVPKGLATQHGPQTYIRGLAAMDARVVPKIPPSKDRGRRESRVRAAPAVSCAMCTGNAHTSIQVQRRASGLPCAMALRLIARSPRRRIPLVTVASQIDDWSEPGWADPISARLGISNGCQDHTTSPYALAPFVYAPVDRSQEARPATTSCAPTLLRPPHHTARFVTIATRPSSRVRRAESNH